MEQLKQGIENLYQDWSVFKKDIEGRPEAYAILKNRMEAIDRDHRVLKNRNMDTPEQTFEVLCQLHQLRHSISELSVYYLAAVNSERPHDREFP